MSSTPRLTVPPTLYRAALRALDRLDEKLATVTNGQRAASDPRWMDWPRRATAVAAGLALLLAGVLMLVLPGPGVLAILLGLSVLAGQFAWARRLLARISGWARLRLASFPTSEAAP